MPVVVTVAGFVLLGAELDGFRREGGGPGRDRFSLVLREASNWFETFADRRIGTWSGNAWQVVGCGARGQPRRNAAWENRGS